MTQQPRRTLRPLPGVALALLLATLAALGIDYRRTPSSYPATALLAGGRDVNLVVRDGVGTVHEIGYDREGHGTLVRTTEDRLTDRVGVAPVIGWDLPYVAEIAAGRRGLRYCANELPQDTLFRVLVIRAVKDTFDHLPGALPAEENCSRPDLVLGATPEQDCGSPLALGCAAYHGSYVRVTAQQNLPDEAVYWVTKHETLHALGLGHTGQYGGEGRSHGHVSCLGFLDYGAGGSNRPVDNPQGVSCLPDLEDGAGGYRFNFRSTPTPTPTPIPTPSPTPTPTPPPLVEQEMDLWLHMPSGAGGCQEQVVGEWLRLVCRAPFYYHRFVERDFEYEEAP